MVFLARKYSITSNLGALLDLLADKVFSFFYIDFFSFLYRKYLFINFDPQ
ncbi:MAG: CDP-alcohol phosphatidyltransferase family protein [Gammaproteobacteria bacterium]